MKMRALLVMVGALGMLAGQVQAQTYDLVVRGGVVMDPESGLEAVRTVAVGDGKIAAITQKSLRGKRTIDAGGRVVAPGFIDIHSHGQNQKYVHDWQLVGLMDVLRAGSLTPARELEASIPALRNKGRLKVGADADIIVFDPARVRATPSVEKPAALPSGMDYVIVNGTVLIDRGRMDPALLPGRPVRREQPAS